MSVGIFSKVYASYDLDEAFKKITEAGMDTVQFNMANMKLSSLPDVVPLNIIEEIKEVQKKYNVNIPVLSGTFNTLELDEEKRKENLHNFEVILETANALSIPFVSISTGSFNQEDFWSAHPDNHTEEAWKLLYSVLDVMLEAAIKNNIVLIVEPEQANVVSTSDDTIRLMKHYNSDHLKVLFDAANVITIDDKDDFLKKIKQTLNDLQEYIVFAHVKDCKVFDNKLEFAAVGQGDLPLNEYLKELRKVYIGPAVMHGLEEEDVHIALDYLKEV